MVSWSNEVFIDCYRTIQYESQDGMDPKLLGLIKSIKQDLSQVLVTPARDETSKQKLLDNKAPIEFSNGDLFKLNEQFIESSILLSTELDLNELAAAEVFFYSNDSQLDINYISGVNFIDRGRQAFFKRYEYILNILGFLITKKQLDLVVSDFNKFGDNLIQSFVKIYRIIDNLNDLITKQFVTNNVNEAFLSSIRYSKTELFNCHELLGQVLYNLVDNYFEKFGNATYYSKIISHLNTYVDDNDLMLIHYFPALLNIVSNIPKLPESEITTLHSQMSSNLNNDYKLVSLNNDVIDLTNSKLKNFEILFTFIYLTNLIPWCKEGSNFQKFNFDDDILNFIQMCLNYGVLENLLRFTNETAASKTIKDFELNNLCDFRGLLQSNFPNMSFVKISTSATNVNNSSQLNNLNANEVFSHLNPEFKISTVFKDDLVPYYWHLFFMNFISHVAIVLTQLRDSEEDYLLSSINKHHRSIRDRSLNSDSDENLGDQNLLLKGGFNGSKSTDNTGLITTGNELSDSIKSPNAGDDELQLNFNEIYLRADLERFYLSFVYTYNERSNLCALVWDDESIKNELLGFINWGVNNNSSPLITATFCLLLSSLTCRENIASTTKIWEILINNNSSFKKTDYSKISMDSIIDSLHYYLNSLNENYENDLNDHFNRKQKRHDFLFSQNPNSNNVSNNIVIELSEDSTIFISGFVLLISSIADKLNDGTERSNEIRQNLFNRFKPIIHGFLRFDNLMINSRMASSKSSDLPAVLINDSNRSVLINLIFHLLKSFNESSNYNLRYEIWEIVDKWMYHELLTEESKPSSETTNAVNIRSNTGLSSAIGSSGTMTVPNSTSTDKINQHIHVVNIKTAFKVNLVDLPNVSNFVELIKDLLTPPGDQFAYSTILPDGEETMSLKLLYPADLGYGYRVNNQIGIWPYMEYLIIEVLSNTNRLKEEELKISLQDDIVTLILTSLSEIDWKFIAETLPYISTNGSFNISKYFTDGLNMNLFIKLHHSVAILNYLYDEKAYKAIFEIINKESDETLVFNSLKTLQAMIDLQDVFNDTFSVNLKEENQGKVNQLGSSSQSSGLSRPPTGFNLLLSSTRTNSTTSLISSSTLHMINSLSIYYPGNFNVIKFADILSYDASIIVKFGLLINSNNIDIVRICLSLLSQVNQKFYESKDDDNLLIKNKLLTLFINSNDSGELKYGFINQFINGDIDLKFAILKFLIDDLNKSNGEPSLTHFILGYDIKGNHLVLPQNQGFIHQLNYYLMTCFESISVIDYNNGVNIIEYNAVMLSSLILSLFYKLCSIPITSDLTLQLLRDFTVEEDNLFELLIKHHVKVDLNTIWDRFKFQEELLTSSNSFINDNLSKLAFFEFFKMRDLIIKYLTVEFHSLTQLGSIYKKNQYLEYLINGGKFLNESHRILNFLDILNFKFSDVELFNYQKFQHLNLNLIYNGMQSKTFKEDNISVTDYATEDKMVTDQLFMKLKKINDFKQEELSEVKSYLTNFIIKENLSNLQSGYLHSWVQLIEVIINDGNLSKEKNQNFILEILSSILPKINEFFDKNNKFSEELISLCVVLFDYYEDDNLFIERLLTLFSTCYKGIVSGNSTIELRNDLYIIMNNFLQKSFKQNNERLLNKIIEILNKIDLNFLAIICNDSIINEGSIRITSIILLESIIHLFNKFNNLFIIDKLIKNNWLLLMIRSVKRIDEIFDDETKEISVILYELINFKSVINLLIRVGQIRTGSAYLIQSELFSILKQSKFLNIDPDLGINLKVNEISKLNLSINSNLNFVNYFEFLIPVFKLISILLISMGPNYKPSKIQGKNLMQHFTKLRDSIIKKDILINNNKIEYQYEKELTELMNQFVLIDSLIE